MTKKNNIGNLLMGTNAKMLGIGVLLLRCTVGVILFVVGSGKVFGWFGGYGLGPTIHAFVAIFGIPALLAYASVFTEFIGGFLLIIGLFTRPAALAITINMLVATIFMLPNGFIAANDGAAWPFSIMMSAIIILLAGPMAYSVDSIIFKQAP